MEKERKCGFRKIGGLYLIGEGMTLSCPAMPIPLNKCEHCGHEIEFFRGFKWMGSKPLLKDLRCPDQCKLNDPFVSCCEVQSMKSFGARQVGLMWIGEKFYTPQEFIQEAKLQGISKRIAAIPKNFKIGETWVFLAHRKAIEQFTGNYVDDEKSNTRTFESGFKQGIFYAFKPSRVELVITESMQHLDWVQSYVKKGVVLSTVPDEPKHHPQQKKKTKRAEYLDKKADDEKMVDLVNQLNSVL